ncbi:MAG: c-type cytochrome biogenesis protein CcmI [Marinosulfonomonas sp.]|nr:MAG: c-type cytochrome biogenesis protein CcmI [Marinosulfonomonas sp.]
MMFWIIIGLLTLLVAMLFVLALLRGRDTGISAAQFDLQIYRDQLSGVERDQERGVVTKEEAARIKTEIQRRILDADKAVQAASAVKGAPRSVTYAAIVACAVVLAGSVWLYQTIGAPGYPDLPLQVRIVNADEARAMRPSQSKAEASLPPLTTGADPRHEEMVAKLRAAIADRPNDLKGHQLLAGNEAALGNYVAAYRAHIKVVEIKGDTATARDLADLADLMIMAAGGYVSPEAESALQRALDRDPNEGKALYYSGLMFAQSGRPDVAFRLWRDLLEVSAPTDLWVPPIRSQIEEAAAWAGVDYTLPELTGGPALAGPDADAVAAASDMSAEERQDMIGNMVVQLSERLATEGGSAQEWAQLIGALGVLGDIDRAKAIWGEAQTVFAADADGLAMIRASAKSVGVAE